MARGNKKHMKRLFAPKDWMLSKLGGVFAPRSNAGPHKLRESLPLMIILRNRLKYALNAAEARMILRQRFVHVDSRIRTDPKYPAGFQDVVEIPKTGDRFRILYDIKGRFSLVKVTDLEAKIKLCKVKSMYNDAGRVPVVVTHDGRRIRYADPKIGHGDTLIVNTQDGKITDVMKFRAGKVGMITGGANRGRVGEILSIERHPGSFDIARMKDKSGVEFATRASNVFIIGQNFDTIAVTLPRAQGIRSDIIEERDAKLIAAEERKQEQLRKRKAHH